MNESIPDNHYHCAHCRKINKFEDYEASRKEFTERFPGHRIEEAEIICDSCYQEFNAWMDKKQRAN